MIEKIKLWLIRRLLPYAAIWPDDTDGLDWTLTGDESVWITKGTLVAQVRADDQGMTICVYPSKDPWEPITETRVTYEEVTEEE